MFQGVCLICHGSLSDGFSRSGDNSIDSSSGGGGGRSSSGF